MTDKQGKPESMVTFLDSAVNTEINWDLAVSTGTSGDWLKESDLVRTAVVLVTLENWQGKFAETWLATEHEPVIRPDCLPGNSLKDSSFLLRMDRTGAYWDGKYFGGEYCFCGLLLRGGIGQKTLAFAVPVQFCSSLHCMGYCILEVFLAVHFHPPASYGH